MAFPRTLSYDWSMDAISKVVTPMDHRFLGAMIFYSILITITWKLWNSDKNKFFAMALMTTPHLMSSNLIAYVGFVAAERILYLPAVGYCMLMGYGIQMIRRR